MTLFILGLVLGVPLSILANMLTPKVKDFVASRSAARARKRVEKISSDYTDRRAMVNDKLAFVAYLLRRSIKLLASVFLTVVASALMAATYSSEPSLEAMVTMLLVLLVMITTFLEFNRVMNYADQVLKFEKYQKRVAKRLSKLGLSSDEISSFLGTRVDDSIG